MNNRLMLPAQAAAQFSRLVLINEEVRKSFRTSRTSVIHVPNEVVDVNIDQAGVEYHGDVAVGRGVGGARDTNAAGAGEGPICYGGISLCLATLERNNTGAVEVEYPVYGDMYRGVTAAGDGVSKPPWLLFGKSPSPLPERCDWGVEKFNMYEVELRQIGADYHLIPSKVFIGKTAKSKEGGRVQQNLEEADWAAPNAAASKRLEGRLERKRLIIKGLWPPAKVIHIYNLSVAQKIEMARIMQEARDSEEV
ncbi:hypothetical protein BKA64DRAFT_641704 [Cadophora sp. MPI-SDFR-AT-0126]|nr:hypothetical protein BKA64DRAFT_641704 [Leotiomycetes sp. MPI-SDFR-AT-0126]